MWPVVSRLDEAVNPFDVASEGHEMHLALPLPSAPVRLEHREL